MKTYFIQAVSGGPIKIGKAFLPKARLKDLQIGNPEELQLVGVLGEDREEALHRQFREERIRGEWFEATERLRNYIKRNTEQVLHAVSKRRPLNAPHPFTETKLAAKFNGEFIKWPEFEENFRLVGSWYEVADWFEIEAEDEEESAFYFEDLCCALNIIMETQPHGLVLNIAEQDVVIAYWDVGNEELKDQNFKYKMSEMVCEAADHFDIVGYSTYLAWMRPLGEFDIYYSDFATSPSASTPDESPPSSPPPTRTPESSAPSSSALSKIPLL